LTIFSQVSFDLPNTYNQTSSLDLRASATRLAVYAHKPSEMTPQAPRNLSHEWAAQDKVIEETTASMLNSLGRKEMKKEKKH
jgi:hypothetical protein